MPQLNMIVAYVRSRLNRDEGATAVEYGLLVAMIALIMMVGAKLFGERLDAFFDFMLTKLPIV
jgi:pilus assembly protein Flp/PilA